VDIVGDVVGFLDGGDVDSDDGCLGHCHADLHHPFAGAAAHVDYMSVSVSERIGRRTDLSGNRFLAQGDENISIEYLLENVMQLIEPSLLYIVVREGIRVVGNSMVSAHGDQHLRRRYSQDGRY
jgi:hypothetical protein